MCSLAMSFLFAYYPLLLLVLVCLYFVPGRGCFIAANLGLSPLRTATMATSTAMRTIVEGMRSVFLAALRQGTAMCYNVSMLISAMRTATVAIINIVGLTLRIATMVTLIGTRPIQTAMRTVTIVAGSSLISARAFLLALITLSFA